MTPMQRYEWATGPDGWLTVAGWAQLGADLMACTTPARTSQTAQRYRDRAQDCFARSNAQRAGAMATLASISRPL